MWSEYAALILVLVELNTIPRVHQYLLARWSVIGADVEHLGRTGGSTVRLQRSTHGFNPKMPMGCKMFSWCLNVV